MSAPHPPEELLRDLKRAGIRGALLGAEDVDELPVLTGAYALILHLARPAPLNRPRGAGNSLAPGWYVYAGSARGPGGIRARLARHLRADKRAHWHIDQLTGLSDACVWASPAPDGHECELVRQLKRSRLFRTACAGFGSTDCRQCEAHLLVWMADRS